MISRTSASERWVLLRITQTRGRIIVVCALLAAAAALAYSLTRPNEYTASASLLFGNQNSQLSQTLFGNNPLPQQTDPTREAATNTDLVTLETVAGLTSRALGGRLSPDPDQVGGQRLISGPVGHRHGRRHPARAHGERHSSPTRTRSNLSTSGCKPTGRMSSTLSTSCPLNIKR